MAVHDIHGHSVVHHEIQFNPCSPFRLHTSVGMPCHVVAEYKIGEGVRFKSSNDVHPDLILRLLRCIFSKSGASYGSRDTSTHRGSRGNGRTNGSGICIFSPLIFFAQYDFAFEVLA